MPLHRFLTLVTVGVIILLILVVHLLPPDDDFRQGNPYWNGLSDMAADTGAFPLNSFQDLPREPADTALILIPYQAIADGELAELRDYVSAGGILVLADDFGHGNQVLSFLELDARFVGSSLLDPVFHHETQHFPRIPRITTARLMMDIESLVFNHATSLANVTPEETIAFSSSLSFLDLNGNESLDDGEPTGPLPVISSHDFGNGTVILISDPSLFINGMQPLANNRDLVSNIATLAPLRLLIDDSHLSPSALRDAKSFLTSTRVLLQTPVAASILVALSLTIALIPLWNERRQH